MHVLKFTANKNYTSHIEHKPGLEIEVDWSGPAMSYTEPDTGERITAYLFVATMPYSQMSYVEAAASMDEKAWLSCHVNMFRFFGGTPVKVVCDNLKTGVTSHPKRGEIILNEAYLSLGEYYSVAIMPTGVKKPKQKASVEGSVGKIATAVIAKLRNDTFPSLAALNAGIRKAVKEFNDKPFQKRPGSRRSIFETDLARIIEMQEKDIKLVDLSYEKRLELLLETLIQERENRLINRLIKNAYFKYPSASIESLDYDARQIKKSTILNLATMGFVANATNLVITGPTGAGKTYLACALGVEACRQTYRVLYIRMPDLMRNFENQSDNLRELTKYRKRIGNYQILILDEWLNYKLTEKDAKNLYELFEQRSGNNSTIFVGQYPVDEWHNRLGGGTQADSIMDRIIHNAYEIPTNETNLRKLYDSKKLKKLVDEIES